MIVAQKKQYYDIEIKQPIDKKTERLQKRKGKKLNSRIKLKIIFSIMVMASLCIGILLGYVQLSEMKYKVYYLNKEVDELEAHVENLRVEVDTIKRSDAIEKRAKEELGMVYPENEQMVFLDINPSNIDEKKKADEKIIANNLIGEVKESIYRIYSLLD